MKFLLVLAVLLVAFWVWRNNRLGDRRDQAPPPSPGPGVPVVMVACDLCGTHLPDVEAIKGAQGVYCCHEHRRQKEGTTP